MMKAALATATMVAGLALAACGTTPGERALSGAGIGAATGAVIGGVTGGDAGTGALVGGAIGAIGGAVTSPDDIYLGEPIWKRRCIERQRRGERISCRRPPPPPPRY